MIYLPTSAPAYTEQLRSAIEGSLDDIRFVWGGPNEGGVSPDGGMTFAAGVLAGQVDQAFALTVAAGSPRQADATGLLAIGADRGLQRKAAQATRILLLVDTIPDQLFVTDQTRFRGFGEAGQATWRIVTAYRGGTNPLSEYTIGASEVELFEGDILEIEAEEPGLTETPTGVSTAINTLPATDGLLLEFGGSDDVVYRGEDAETIPSFRARLNTTPSAANGSAPGLYAALANLTGVRAVSLQPTAPAQGRIVIAGSAALGDLVNVAEVAYRNLPVFSVIEGSQFIQLDGVDGRPYTLPLDVGTVQDVEVSILLVIDQGLTREEAEQRATAIVQEAFNTVASRGVAEINHLEVLTALRFSDSVRKATLLLDGSPDDVAATLSTSLLQPDFVSVRALRPGETA